MTINNQEKIITLWSVFLFGTIFHTQLGLMPLFYGESVAMSGTNGVTNVSHLLNIVAFEWMQAHFNHKQPRKQLLSPHV